MLLLNGYPNVGIDGGRVGVLALDVLGGDIDAANRAVVSYEQSVLREFNRIAGMQTGAAVVRQVRQLSSRTMIIQPYLLEKDPKTGRFKMANASAASVKPEWPAKRGRTGQEDTVITFSPADWLPNGLGPVLGLPARHRGPGTDPDEILLHEMVHGLRQMAGLYVRRHVPFQRDYDGFEDFFAILIANIYRSEHGRTGLRSDHHGFEDLAVKQGVASEQAFLDRHWNKAHLRMLRRQQRQLFADLQAVKAPFNPTRLL